MLEQIDVTKQLSEKSLLEKLKFKLDKRNEKENFLVPRDIFTSCMESYKEHRKKHEKVKKEEDEELQDEYKSFNLGLKDKDYLEKESECETTQEELVDDVRKTFTHLSPQKHYRGDNNVTEDITWLN